MPWPRLLLLSAVLTGSALGQVTPPSVPPVRSQPAPRLNPDELNADIARKAPAYGGFFVKDGVLRVFVTSTDPTQRQAAVRELFQVRGEELRRRGFSPEKVVFVSGQFNADQLLQAKEAARGIDGWYSIDIDETRNRVVVGLLLPGMEERAQTYLAEQGLPPGIVIIPPPPAGKLHEGPVLTAPHQARLEVPSRVAQGDMLRAQLRVTNLAGQTLRLEHGACAFRMEILQATTGEVVLPTPGAYTCTSQLLHTVVPARSTVTLAAPEWNLRTPGGDLVPPGRYVLRASFEVGVRDEQIIRPPDQTFEVVASNPATGTAQVRDVLRSGIYGMAFQALLGEERGQQMVFVLVPDRRAQAGVERLLRERKLPLDRVRFRKLPPTRVPASGEGEARLKVESHTSPSGTQHGFELSADVAPWLTRGAWRCEPVVNVVDPRSGEVVGGSPSFGSGGARRPCAEGGRPLPYPWGGGWNERRSDGTPLPTGTYDVRAGLKVTLKTGQIVWLVAPVQELTVP